MAAVLGSLACLSLLDAVAKSGAEKIGDERINNKKFKKGPIQFPSSSSPLPSYPSRYHGGGTKARRKTQKTTTAFILFRGGRKNTGSFVTVVKAKKGADN
jgi:hypothetical protein